MLIAVLIVDDDPMILQINRAYVESLSGFRVVGTARSGREALEQAKRLRPDLILLDVFMPDTDGLATLRELRSNAVPVDVIMISAAQEATTIQEVLRSGAFGYIIKPFRFERLRATLQSYQTAKQQLGSAGTLSQEQLDRVFRSAGQRSIPEEPPKGLNELTLKQVLACMALQPEPRTATEIAELMGIARVTARRYLEYLEQLGKVRVELQYGGVGRPLNRYSLEE